MRNVLLIKKWLLLVVAVAVIGLLLMSWHYGKSPLYISRVLLRGVALHVVGLIVTIHDPTPPLFRCSIGPESRAVSQDCLDTPEKLAEAVVTLFPGNTVSASIINNNEVNRSKYLFVYQSLSDPRLISLRKKYGFSNLISSTDDDFRQIITLMDWVHGQWRHGTSGAKIFDSGAFNADVILTHARHGDRFWCHVYAMTFVQVAASLGYQARLVSLTKDGYQSSDMHAIVEAWSNRYAKWIAVDPDFNIWYERAGIPLNVLEIHDAVLGRTVDKIKIIKGIRRSDDEFERRIPKLFDYYRYFYIDMRNDWLSNRYFHGHPKRSDAATMFWDDRRLPPVLSLMTKVNSFHDLYWDINKTHVSFVRPEITTRTIPICLDTVTPNYSHFEMVLDGTLTVHEKSGKFFWKMHAGRNSLTVYSVNTFGRRGLPVKVVVDVGIERKKF